MGRPSLDSLRGGSSIALYLGFRDGHETKAAQKKVEHSSLSVVVASGCGTATDKTVEPPGRRSNRFSGNRLSYLTSDALLCITLLSFLMVILLNYY